MSQKLIPYKKMAFTQINNEKVIIKLYLNFQKSAPTEFS